MNERHTKKTANNTVTKDMYSKVLICQIIGICCFMLVFFFMVKGNDSSYSELKALLTKELFTAEDIIYGVRTYFSDSKSWAVSGDNVAYLPEDTTNEDLSGVGGEDLKLYGATDITSFAPIKSTSPAISPIENGRYTSYFGYRINPITKEFAFHTGLDIAADEGTKIRAAYSGKVTKIGEDDRAGKYIFVTHQDGLVTFYCHCSEIIAEVGANIRQGETIAKVGSTGWSTGPHLHFEVRKDNIRYNPLYIL